MLESGFDFDRLLRLIKESASDGKRHFFLIDTVFSLPHRLLIEHGIDTHWEEQMHWLASFESALSWRKACRAVNRKEFKRLTDRINKAPFPPTNVRMFRQTWCGMVFVLKSLRKAKNVAVLPFDVLLKPQVWRKSPIWVGEGCPACFLRKEGLPYRNYKGKEKGCMETRKKLLYFLKEREGIEIDSETASLLIKQSGADALDSLLLLPSAKKLPTQNHDCLLYTSPSPRD